MRKRPQRPIAQQAPALPELNADALDTTERVIAYCIKNDLIDGTEVNIESLIELNPNLTLKKKNLKEGIDAHIRELAENKYEIAVNSQHSRTRQRFSMAHEFAHYQLHRDNLAAYAVGERILHRSDERNLIEQQANTFAANLLMPEDLFRAEVSRTSGNITELAKRFNVSPLALRYRAKTLGFRVHGV